MMSRQRFSNCLPSPYQYEGEAEAGGYKQEGGYAGGGEDDGVLEHGVLHDEMIVDVVCLLASNKACVL